MREASGLLSRIREFCVHKVHISNFLGKLKSFKIKCVQMSLSCKIRLFKLFWLNISTSKLFFSSEINLKFYNIVSVHSHHKTEILKLLFIIFQDLTRFNIPSASKLSSQVL